MAASFRLAFVREVLLPPLSVRRVGDKAQEQRSNVPVSNKRRFLDVSQPFRAFKPHVPEGQGDLGSFCTEKTE